MAGGEFVFTKKYSKYSMVMLSMNAGVNSGVATALLRATTISYGIQGPFHLETIAYLASALVFNIN